MCRTLESVRGREVERRKKDRYNTHCSPYIISNGCPPSLELQVLSVDSGCPYCVLVHFSWQFLIIQYPALSCSLQVRAFIYSGAHTVVNVKTTGDKTRVIYMCIQHKGLHYKITKHSDVLCTIMQAVYGYWLLLHLDLLMKNSLAV